MTLGAAIGATVLVTPAWKDAYELNSIGGVMAAMLVSDIAVANPLL